MPGVIRTRQKYWATGCEENQSESSREVGVHEAQMLRVVQELMRRRETLWRRQEKRRDGRKDGMRREEVRKVEALRAAGAEMVDLHNRSLNASILGRERKRA